MTVYEVIVVTFSCDIMCEDYSDGLFSTMEKAETYILEKGLLDDYPETHVRVRHVL